MVNKVYNPKTKYNKYLSMIDAEDSDVFANYRLINLFVTNFLVLIHHGRSKLQKFHSKNLIMLIY